MAPGDLQAGRIAGRVPLQIEGLEMEPSTGRNALFRLSGHGGETHTTSSAKDARQDLTIPISQPFLRGLAGDGKNLLDLSIDPAFQ